MLAEWIYSCDRTHQCYPPKESFLPTRVLDVGNGDSTTIRLRCDTRGQTRPGTYLALSHRWGSPTQSQKLCTYTTNIERLKQRIDLVELPKTFRDAVSITRSLGVQFLWIDSLCIVQDDAHDWEMESKLMEQVFSSAYITLAASCASGFDDGFLRFRPKRKCVTKRNANGVLYYLCDSIDNFQLDVDQGELNKRGWVLQERALSRRTIYFTEKQTYWECGGGVRCETLTKMRNRKASFLGDANFPNLVETYVKGMKIHLYQDLYERYSKLELSFSADRPIAIKGLEKRLIRTLKTVGGYGVFDCYLHRCLLWGRSGDALKRILVFRAEPIPSWSWMAYDGGIKYMNVPFGSVSWAEDVTSPFQNRAQIDLDESDNAVTPLEIKAQARDIIDSHDLQLILDEPARDLNRPPKCVIIGSDKDTKSTEHRKHYALIISPMQNGEEGVYERIGVAVLEGRHIALEESGQIVRIR